MPCAIRSLACFSCVLLLGFVGCGGDGGGGTPPETGDCEIEVRTPEEGDVFCTGKNIDLWWLSDHTSGTVDVDLYHEDEYVGRLRDGRPNLGAFDISCNIFDASPGDSFSLRVADANDAGCYGNSDYFTVVDPDTCSMVVTNPAIGAGYQTVYDGSSMTVRWESDRGSDAVDINLIMENRVVAELANNTANDGEFEWVIESRDCVEQIYFINIRDAVAWNNDSACEANSGLMRISFVPPDSYDCEMSISAPTAATVWQRRSDVAITFTASNLVGDTVKLELFTADGSTLLATIEEGLDVGSGLNLYHWTVDTGENHSQNLACFLRVTDETSSCCVLDSWVFTITGYAK